MKFFSSFLDLLLGVPNFLLTLLAIGFKLDKLAFIFVPVRLLVPELPEPIEKPDLKLLFPAVDMSCRVFDDSLLAPVFWIAPIFDFPRVIGVLDLIWLTMWIFLIINIYWEIVLWFPHGACLDGVLLPKEIFPENWELPLDFGSTLNFLYSKDGIFTKKVKYFKSYFYSVCR